MRRNWPSGCGKSSRRPQREDDIHQPVLILQGQEGKAPGHPRLLTHNRQPCHGRRPARRPAAHPGCAQHPSPFSLGRTKAMAGLPPMTWGLPPRHGPLCRGHGGPGDGEAHQLMLPGQRLILLQTSSATSGSAASAAPPMGSNPSSLPQQSAPGAKRSAGTSANGVLHQAAG